MSEKTIKPDLVHNDDLLFLVLKCSFLTILFFFTIKTVVPIMCLELQFSGVLPSKAAQTLWLFSNIIGGLIWWSIPLALTMPYNFGQIQYGDGFHHKKLMIFFIILTTLWITIIPIDLISHGICIYQYSKLVKRSEIVVKAIDKFIEDNGTPPTKLGVLVPSYLPSEPKVGTPMNLGYRYFSVHNDPGHLLDKSKYELSIDMDHDYCFACPFHIPSLTYRKGRKHLEESFFPNGWQYGWQYLD